MSHLTATSMRSAESPHVLRRRAEAEYVEMPGLKLTAAQAARLWHLDVTDSTALLESMVESGHLHKTRDGAYLLLSAR